MAYAKGHNIFWEDSKVITRVAWRWAFILEDKTFPFIYFETETCLMQFSYLCILLI